jgi:hypothetical protein
MQSLIINDLPRSEQLDSSAMIAIQGGRPNMRHLLNLPDLPTLPPPLDPSGPYGINGFVLPEGAAD